MNVGYKVYTVLQEFHFLCFSLDSAKLRQNKTPFCTQTD